MSLAEKDESLIPVHISFILASDTLHTEKNICLSETGGA